MVTRQTKENLSETFITGFLAVFKISGYKKTFFSSWVTIIPIFISILLILFTFLLKIDSYNFLIEIKSNMIGFLPGILGFTIAGYSLMVGFIQAGMLDQISEPLEDSKFSLYQKMSSAFAVNVILQGIALIIAYIAHFIIYIDSQRNIELLLPNWYKNTVNYITLLVLCYWFSLSVLMVIQIVLNIFGFSQLHHYFVNKNKIGLQEEADKAKNENL